MEISYKDVKRACVFARKLIPANPQIQRNTKIDRARFAIAFLMRQPAINISIGGTPKGSLEAVVCECLEQVGISITKED